MAKDFGCSGSNPDHGLINNKMCQERELCKLRVIDIKYRRLRLLPGRYIVCGLAVAESHLPSWTLCIREDRV